MSTIEIDTTGAALVADAAAVSLEPPCFDVRGLEAPVFEAPVFEVPGLETPGLETPDLGALSPGVLRSLSPVALVALAERICGFLVHAVSVTGGPLGSNLAVVELK